MVIALAGNESDLKATRKMTIEVSITYVFNLPIHDMLTVRITISLPITKISCNDDDEALFLFKKFSNMNDGYI